MMGSESEWNYFDPQLDISRVLCFTLILSTSSVISVLIVVVGRELVVETSRLRCMLLEREKGDCLVRPRQLKDLMKDYMDNVMLYHGIGRRSEAKNEFELDLRQSDLVFKEKDELWKEKGWSNSQDASNIKCSRDLGQRVWKDREEVHIGYYKLMNLQLGENFLFDELRVLMPRVVKSRDEIFSRWGYCDNHDLSRLDNQSIERDRLIGIGFVLNFVKFISFTFGDKEMISVIEAVSR
ncbi:hypothetical protein Tco_0784462 [Tanacetum coccineum]